MLDKALWNAYNSCCQSVRTVLLHAAQADAAEIAQW